MSASRNILHTVYTEPGEKPTSATQSTDLSAVKRDANLQGRRTTADYVAEGLRDAIQSGSLPDGAALNQAAIATHFGVSRVPVREAMRQLVAEGLIETRAHHLAVVRGLSLARIAEIYDLRAVLEGHLTQRAVPNIDEAMVQKLRQKEREMRSVRDHSKWLRLNADFHRTILRAAENDTGLELVDQLHSQAERYVRMWSGGKGIHRPEEAGDEHVQIIERIAAKDSRGARRAVEGHIRHTGERLVAYGRSLEDTRPGT